MPTIEHSATDFVAAWIADLAAGPPQAWGDLQTSTGYCCLGRACVVAEDQFGIPALREPLSSTGRSWLLGPDLDYQPAGRLIRAALRIVGATQTDLIAWNDNTRLTHPEIARRLADLTSDPATR